MLSETYINTALIAIIGALHAGNLFWFKTWKDRTDKKIDDMHHKVDNVAEDVSYVKGYLNGKPNAR